jgi:hypothetical protein
MLEMLGLREMTQPMARKAPGKLITMARNRWPVIVTILWALSGCRASDESPRQDETINRLCSISDIAGVMFKRGTPAPDFATFEAFLAAALRERVAEKHEADKLRNDGWGNSFRWSLVQDSLGIEVVVTCVRQRGPAIPDHEIVMRCRGKRHAAPEHATWNAVFYRTECTRLDVPCATRP